MPGMGVIRFSPTKGVYDHYNTGVPAHPTADGATPNLSGTPLFYFGTGLSYTTFNFTDLAVRVHQPGADVVATATVALRNTGSVDGVEVVQIYVEDPIMQYVRPEKAAMSRAKTILTAESPENMTSIELIIRRRTHSTTSQ